MTALILVAILILMTVLRQSIVLTAGIAVAFIHTYMTKSSVEFLIQDIWYAVDREVLLSIPMFIFAGLLMARGSIAARLVRIMKALTSSIPGGLGIASILAMTAFSAISGSSAVTMLAVGMIMYPALLANNYSKSYALGMLCAGGTLGVIIPPSVLMIVYGIMTEVSITDLFLAGWGPGLSLAFALCLYTFVVNRNKPTQSFEPGEIMLSLRDGISALMMPVILLGGIYSGYFTVTEAAAVSVVYALVVESLVHRELGVRDVLRIVLETVKLQGALMMLLAIAISLNNVLDFEGVPQALVGYLRGVINNQFTMLLAVNFVLLLAGALMDEISAIIILAPLLAPLGEAYGFHPVHFGIITIVNLQIGYVAPPVALNLIVAMMTFKEPFGFICRAVIPFIAIMLLVLIVVCAYPPLTLFLLR